MPPTFTVVIPAFNAAAYIVDALDSVSAQTHAVDQIVVVDDGSTDDTATLVQDWGVRHPSAALMLVRQKNGGLPNARNTGLRAATSSWILLLDADDEFGPTHVACLAVALALRDDLAAVFSKGYFFNADGPIGNASAGDTTQEHKALAASDSQLAPGVHLMQQRLFESLVPGNYIHPSCLCFDRRVAQEIGNFDETLRVCEDRDFLLRLSRTGPFAFVAQVTGGIRIHENNISHPKNTVRNHYFAARVLQKALGMAASLRLSPAELALVQQELRRTVDAYLYAASGTGMAAYRQALQQARQASFDIAARPPLRHLARALRHTLGAGRPARP